MLFSPSVMSDSLRPHGLQHTRLPCPSCPSLFPGACSNSCPLSRWCHPTISSSVAPFSSCPPSFPASGSFPVSQLFTSGDHSTRASSSTSVLPVNIQGWFPLGLTGLISLLSKGLWRVIILRETSIKTFICILIGFLVHTDFWDFFIYSEHKSSFRRPLHTSYPSLWVDFWFPLHCVGWEEELGLWWGECLPCARPALSLLPRWAAPPARLAALRHRGRGLGHRRLLAQKGSRRKRKSSPHH